MEPVRVRFNGLELWWLRDKEGGGPLAPLDHCDENGEIVDDVTAMLGESYAHVFPGIGIMRYNEKIGTVDDLELPKPQFPLDATTKRE